MKKKILNKKNAFTLPEVVVATFISSLIISFTFLFLADTIEGVSNVENDSNILSSFYDFTTKLNNYRNLYITGGILVDNSSLSDVFLMEDPSGKTGVLFGSVGLSDNKLNLDNTIYEARGIGFRKVSSTEMSEIKSDVNVIYNYLFHVDQVFPDLKIKDFNLIKYNSGLVYDLEIIIDLDFRNKLIGESWDNLPRDTLNKININF